MKVEGVRPCSDYVIFLPGGGLGLDNGDEKFQKIYYVIGYM